MMEVKFESKSKRRKDDAVNLLILLFIASLLGIYAITTTVLIAQDGIYYIQQAQKFSSNPTDVVKLHPPGYPFLIFIAHKFVSLFSSSPSALTWIYSAQSITLLCRLFAIIPLYFIGKLLVGSRNSFWALLILILLPYPSEFGSDVLRDWPHILFLAMGFSFLLFGAMEGKWWMFGIVGFASGLGHMIRPECAQLVI
ncbi:MAG: glycosyltransferase family 39 protein, partial [Thermoplasmata archaeon]